jgi:hypothetical protein
MCRLHGKRSRTFPLDVAQRTFSSQGLSIGGYNGVMRVVMQINTIIGHNKRGEMHYIPILEERLSVSVLSASVGFASTYRIFSVCSVCAFDEGWLRARWRRESLSRPQ